MPRGVLNHTKGLYEVIDNAYLNKSQNTKYKEQMNCECPSGVYTKH